MSYEHFKLSTPYRRTQFANVFILDHSHMQKHTHTCTHFATILKFFLTVYVFFWQLLLHEQVLMLYWNLFLHNHNLILITILSLSSSELICQWLASVLYYFIIFCAVSVLLHSIFKHFSQISTVTTDSWFNKVTVKLYFCVSFLEWSLKISQETEDEKLGSKTRELQFVAKIWRSHSLAFVKHQLN